MNFAFKVHQIVYPLLGPWKNSPCKIISIEWGTGAMNGWFTVLNENGEKLLFAGEEITSEKI